MTITLTDHADRLDASASLVELHRVIDRLQNSRGSGNHDETVVEIDRAIRRLSSVKLSVIAEADAARISDRTGLADTSSWVARRTRTGSADAAREVRLAAALATPRPCAEALAGGALSPAHAQVIVTATDQLPAGLSAAKVEEVELDLIAHASHLAPDQLRRVARRSLAAVEADRAVVDRHEDALLRSEEEAALAKTRLTWHDNGDGTTSGHFTVPTVAAAILARAIQSMTAPRRARLGATHAQAGDPLARRDWPHQSGTAFVELLEHLPTDGLHGKVAATVVVTIEHGKLAAGVGGAGLDTGEAMSAGELRRLACGAGLLPAVLNGASLPLDLGRTSRLFTEAQRVPLATRHSTCAADGCERPYAWCELHHRVPWSQDGRTDLVDAVPLCGFHHRRIHDPRYHHQRGSAGITFVQRQ